MATLDRWEPFRGSYDSQLNRLFSDFFGRTSQDQNLTPWAPAVDILEGEHELVVKADLPDIQPEELDIRVENNILTIRGERKFENEERKENFVRVERSYGRFQRSFTLGVPIKTEVVAASYKDGILEVHLPKSEETKPRKIGVNAG